MIRGALAGAVAGLVAAWAMESFQAAWTRPSQTVEPAASRRRDGQATVNVATAVAEPMLERRLSEGEKEVAGETVHYAFGGINGAIYGALVDVVPPLRAFNGMLFGTALWLGADELMLWGLGISKKPTEHQPSQHVYALASHLVYGLTLETVRRAIRWSA